METKVSDHPIESHEFSAIDAEEVAEYRSPSMLSAASLVLGLASALVFVGPLLYVVPALGIVFGLFALRKIAASDGGLTGCGAAIAGIILSTVCLFAAESNANVTRFILRTQARSLAEKWFTYLQAGATKDAMSLTQPLPAPPPHAREAAEEAHVHFHGEAAHDDSQEEPPAFISEEQRNLDAFVKRPVVQALVNMGANGNIEFIEDLSFAIVKPGLYRVEQLYRVTPNADDGSERAMMIHMTMERYSGRLGGRPFWLIVGYQEETAHSPMGSTP